MIGRIPTKAEKEWMRQAREVSCIVCIKRHLIAPFSVPSEYTCLHHIEGKTKPDAHFLTIPLCEKHHQTSEEAVHFNKARFEARNGTQAQLLRHVKRLIAEKSTD